MCNPNTGSNNQTPHMQELRPSKNKDNRALRAYQRTSCVWGNRFQIVLSPQYSHKRQSETSPPEEGTGKSKNAGFENKKPPVRKGRVTSAWKTIGKIGVTRARCWQQRRCSQNWAKHGQREQVGRMRRMPQIAKEDTGRKPRSGGGQENELASQQ